MVLLAADIAAAHVNGTHQDHLHHFNVAGSEEYHEHWWGACYKHVTYQHVDSIHHLDANGTLQEHQWIGETGYHLHETYVSWWGNCG